MKAGPKQLNAPWASAESPHEALAVRWLRALDGSRRFLSMVHSIFEGVSETGILNGIVTSPSLERILGSVELPDRPPPLTRFEKPADQEALAISRMARRAALTVIDNYCKGKQANPALKALRDQHAKSHGLLRARFVVAADLPREFTAGIFRPGASYAAFVRFSNAKGVPGSDRRPDGRGMAIKILRAPGQSLLSAMSKVPPGPSPHTEQDFLLTDYPVFFCRNVQDYTRFLEILALPQCGRMAKLKWFAKFLFFFVPGRLPQLWIFFRTAMERVDNPLHAAYHSMTPYLFGEDKVVRYVAMPRSTTTRAPGDGGGDDFLHAAMAAELDPAAGSRDYVSAFDFAVQVRDRATPDDVEDASRNWRRPQDVRVTLARVEVPRQHFSAPERCLAGENLSFSPWHCLPEHRPLGGLNRMRLAVYRASLEIRHRLNMISASDASRAAAGE